MASTIFTRLDFDATSLAFASKSVDSLSKKIRALGDVIKENEKALKTETDEQKKNVLMRKSAIAAAERHLATQEKEAKVMRQQQIVTNLVIQAKAKLFSVVKNGIEMYADYQKELDKTQMLLLVSGKTAAESSRTIKELAASYNKLSADTGQTRSNIAKAGLTLKRAGFDGEMYNTMLKSIAWQSKILGVDMADLAKDVISFSKIFDIKDANFESEFRKIATAVSTSNMEMSDWAETMQYIGPIAKSLGISTTDMTADISALADAGIKGSQAGTVLRQMYTRLAAPSGAAAKSIKKLGVEIYGADNKMRSLREIMPDLKKKFEEMGDGADAMQKKQQMLKDIFGQRQLAGANALMESSVSLEEYYARIKAAEDEQRRLEEEYKKTFTYAWDQAATSLQTFAEEVGKVFAPLVSTVSDWFKTLVDINKATGGWVAKIAGGLAVVIAIGSAWRAISVIGAAMVSQGKTLVTQNMLGANWLTKHNITRRDILLKQKQEYIESRKQLMVQQELLKAEYHRLRYMRNKTDAQREQFQLAKMTLAANQAALAADSKSLVTTRQKIIAETALAKAKMAGMVAGNIALMALLPFLFGLLGGAFGKGEGGESTPSTPTPSAPTVTVGSEGSKYDYLKNQQQPTQQSSTVTNNSTTNAPQVSININGGDRAEIESVISDVLRKEGSSF